MKPRTTPLGRRPRIGTFAMIVGVLGFGVYSFLSQPASSSTRYYEADASGKLQLVERPAFVAGRAPKLDKPEPQRIVDQAKRLGLDSAQLDSVQRIAEKYESDKRSLLGRMDQETAFLASGAKSSLSGLQSRMGGYSNLSREYGRVRQQAWDAAVAVLTPSQKTKLEVLSGAKEEGETR